MVDRVSPQLEIVERASVVEGTDANESVGQGRVGRRDNGCVHVVQKGLDLSGLTIEGHLELVPVAIGEAKDRLARRLPIDLHTISAVYEPDDVVQSVARRGKVDIVEMCWVLIVEQNKHVPSNDLRVCVTLELAREDKGANRIAS